MANDDIDKFEYFRDLFIGSFGGIGAHAALNYGFFNTLLTTLAISFVGFSAISLLDRIYGQDEEETLRYPWPPHQAS